MIDSESGLLEVSLASLADIPSGQQFERLLAQAIDDVRRRPGDKRKRKVGLMITIEPKTEIENLEGGGTELHLTGMEMSLESKISFPSRGPIKYDCGISGERLIFNPECPYNHRQKSLPIIEGGQMVAVKHPNAG